MQPPSSFYDLLYLQHRQIIIQYIDRIMAGSREGSLIINLIGSTLISVNTYIIIDMPKSQIKYFIVLRYWSRFYFERTKV